MGSSTAKRRCIGDLAGPSDMGFLALMNRDVKVNQRWIWLSIKTHVSNKRDDYYVPESVLRCIPIYAQQIDEKLAVAQDRDDIIISDTTFRTRASITETIRFLTTGHLRPLDTAQTVRRDLLDLLSLYNFSTLLSIKRLELGILAHIDGFHGLGVPLFLAGARFYYGIGGKRETSLGHVIKKRLWEFLPQMIELKAVDEIKTEGGIWAHQLMEVLLEKVIASEAKQPNMTDQAVLIKAELGDK